MTERTSSSSNALYRGEARDFRHAMQLVIAQCQAEQRLTAGWPAEDKGDLPDLLAAYIAAARRCLAEYEARVRAAETELALAWQKSADEDVRRIGEALARGDYSDLAI